MVASWLTFRAEFPKGVSLTETAAPIPPEGEAPQSTTWVGALSESTQAIVGFLVLLCDFRKDVRAVMKSAVGQNPLITAESFLAREDLRSLGVLDLDAVAEKYAQEGAPLPPPPVVQPPLPPPAQGSDCPPSPSHGPTEDPDAEAPSDMADVLKKSFPSLMLPDEALDKVRRIDIGEFQAMMEHAELRAALSRQPRAPLTHALVVCPN